MYVAHLTLVADGHIHITGVQVTYGKGPRGKWSVEQDLDETAPNHQVDITDAKNRPIRSVTVTYRGRTGGKKRTTVTLWAQ